MVCEIYSGGRARAGFEGVGGFGWSIGAPAGKASGNREARGGRVRAGPPGILEHHRRRKRRRVR